MSMLVNNVWCAKKNCPFRARPECGRRLCAKHCSATTMCRTGNWKKACACWKRVVLPPDVHK